MVLDGERSGRLRPGMTILDATSGNTGIAYGMIGAARGYPVTICLPKNASRQRKRILASFGVELIETDPLMSTDGAQLVARELSNREPDKYFYPDQYNNPANWRAHYETTAAEIWQQTEGRITHFIAGLGTSGTFVGVTRRLKELNPKVRAISLQPDSPFHGLEGLKHMATAMVPGIYDSTLADESVTVSTEEGQEMSRRLALEEGLCVQAMHIGPYADEPATVARMNAFLVENGLANDLSDTRRHHEIYLGDPRRVAPERMRTVLRHPIRKAS
jgi:cysteine synthase B